MVLYCTETGPLNLTFDRRAELFRITSSHQIGGFVKIKLLMSALVALSAQIANAEELKISGGAAPMGNIFRPVAEPFTQATKIKLVLSEGGPDVAWKDLEDGKIDAASAGLAFNDWLDLMKKKNIEIKDPSSYKPIIVGRDKIKVLVHKDLSVVKALSREQLKAVFTGKTKNWKEVGGPDLAIKVVFGEKIPGTNKYWQERVMEKEEFAKSVTVSDMASIIKAVGEAPGSIAIGALVGAKDSGVYAIEDIPDVSRPITIITKGAPSPTMQKLLDYIKKEGQQYIAR